MGATDRGVSPTARFLSAGVPAARPLATRIRSAFGVSLALHVAGWLAVVFLMSRLSDSVIQTTPADAPDGSVWIAVVVRIAVDALGHEVAVAGPLDQEAVPELPGG
jgi:hypothetical protein